MNFTATATRLDPLQLPIEKKAAPEEMTVRAGQALSLRGCQLGACIRVLAGMLWITQEGDANDYLVRAEDVFVTTRRGRVVVESLDEVGRFVVSPAGA